MRRASNGDFIYGTQRSKLQPNEMQRDEIHKIKSAWINNCISNDMQKRMESGESLSKAETQFMKRNVENIKSLNLSRNKNGELYRIDTQQMMLQQNQR